jgi:putative membrane protein
MPFLGHFYALIVTLVFLAIIVVGGVWLVLWAIRVSPSRVRPDNALAILKERFARGEIDQQEYEKRRDALQNP